MPTPALVDQYGQPINRPALKQVQATPDLARGRLLSTLHPSVGLEPSRLAAILRGAETDDPSRYLELAEEMEEKDLHYLGVLGSRKRAVAQLEITVEAASDDKDDVAAADLVRNWIDRAELEDELFHALDAVGKGVSCLEIIWDVSESQYQPVRLEWRPPQWFRFDETGQRLMLKDGVGRQPLTPFKFIETRIMAKSGLPIRGGLARAAAWCWMFKNFGVKDWVLFAEAYGQPVRLGKYGSGASAEEKATLLDAVSNIATDFAAIIPETMNVEFVSADAPKGGDLYLAMLNYFDTQISKAVLGQTATTDAIKGGYAVGKVHSDVRDDIKRADAKQVASAFNTGLVKPLVDLNVGPRKLYPRLRIGLKQETDLTVMSTALSKLVPLGLKVGMSTVRDKMGFPDPDKDEEVLQGSAPASDPGENAENDPPASDRPKVKEVASAMPLPPQRQDMIDRLAGQLDAATRGAMDGAIDKLKALVNDPSITSLEELGAHLVDAYPEMDMSDLADLLTRVMSLGDLAGRQQIQDGTDPLA